MTAKKHTNPGKIETVSDCAELAAYEWENEVDQKLWNKDRERYITVRSAHLAARIKPKAEFVEEKRDEALTHET